MNPLMRNEQAPIGEADRQAVVLEVGWSQAGTSAGAYAFLLDAAAVLPSPAHVVVASGSGAHGGAVRLYNDSRGDHARAQLQVHVAGIDTRVQRLRVVLAAAQRNDSAWTVRQLTTWACLAPPSMPWHCKRSWKRNIKFTPA